MTFESQSQNPIEFLKDRLSELKREEDRVLAQIEASGENVGPDVELGSEEHRDFGYTERLNEIRAEIAKVEESLRDADDKNANRNLPL